MVLGLLNLAHLPRHFVHLVDHLVLLSNELLKLFNESLVGLARLLRQVVRHLAQYAIDSLFDLLGDGFGPLLYLLLLRLLHLDDCGVCVVSPLFDFLNVDVALHKFHAVVITRF